MIQGNNALDHLKYHSLFIPVCCVVDLLFHENVTGWLHGEHVWTIRIQSVLAEGS